MIIICTVHFIIDILCQYVCYGIVCCEYIGVLSRFKKLTFYDRLTDLINAILAVTI